jgi:hypothetical protein
LLKSNEVFTSPAYFPLPSSMCRRVNLDGWKLKLELERRRIE